MLSACAAFFSFKRRRPSSIHNKGLFGSIRNARSSVAAAATESPLLTWLCA
jgi:hypothetical protein